MISKMTQLQNGNLKNAAAQYARPGSQMNEHEGGSVSQYT